MNKKILLFLVLQVAVFSASATSISFSSLDGTLDLSAIGNADQARIFADIGEDVSSESPITFNLNLLAPVRITSTMNLRTGFDDPFSLELVDPSAASLFSLTRTDFAAVGPTGEFGIFSTLFNPLVTGAYQFRFSGPVVENASSLTLRVAAVPVPAAVWLFGSALAGLAVISRRRKMIEAV